MSVSGILPIFVSCKGFLCFSCWPSPWPLRTAAPLKSEKNVTAPKWCNYLMGYNRTLMSADKTQQLAQKLAPFVPEQTAPMLAHLIIRHKVRFKISRPRATRYGDYRAPQQGSGHRISVNGNLNPYAFYITALHEFAHLIAYESFGHKIAPHGKEWKSIFGELLSEALQKDVFPEDVAREVQRHLQSPAASGCADHDLMRALRNYDEHPAVLLEELPEQSRFVINGNRVFEKGALLRKRYRCLDVQNQRFYLISGIAEVVPLHGK